MSRTVQILTIAASLLLAADASWAGELSRIKGIDTYLKGPFLILSLLGDQDIKSVISSFDGKGPDVRLNIPCRPGVKGKKIFSVKRPPVRSVELEYFKDRIDVAIHLYEFAAFSTRILENNLEVAFLTESGPAGSSLKKTGRQGGKDEGEGTLKGLFKMVETDPAHMILISEAPSKIPGAGLFNLSLFYLERGDFKKALSGFEKIVREQGREPLVGRARFLAAYCKYRLFLRGQGGSYEALEMYEKAVNLYLGDDLLPEAYLFMADLYERSGRIPEALAHVNLVLKKGRGRFLRGAARMKKAQILFKRGRIDDAFEIGRQLAEEFEGVCDTSDILYLMALVHKLKGRNRKALDLFDKIKKRDDSFYLRFPSIFLHTGEIKKELKRWDEAAEDLLLGYNLNPEGEKNYLSLAQAGDLFREMGMHREAVKLFGLILKRYPGSEVADISKIRIAEYSEARGKDILFLTKGLSGILFDKKMATPEGLYREVAEPALAGNSRDPLPFLAALKLASMYQKRGKYIKSIDTVERLKKAGLLEQFSAQADFLLEKALSVYLGKLYEKKRFDAIVDYYKKKKNLIDGLPGSKVLLYTAMSLYKAGDKALAVPLFIKLDFDMEDREKPAEMLFELIKVKAEKGLAREAEKYLDLLLKKKGVRSMVRDASMLLADLYTDKKEVLKADAMYGITESSLLDPDKKAAIRIKRLDLLLKGGFIQKCLGLLAEMELKITDENIFALYHRRAGDIYFRQKMYGAALKHYEYFLSVEKDKKTRDWINFKRGICFLKLGKRTGAINLFKSLVDSEDVDVARLSGAMVQFGQ